MADPLAGSGIVEHEFLCGKKRVLLAIKEILQWQVNLEYVPSLVMNLQFEIGFEVRICGCSRCRWRQASLFDGHPSQMDATVAFPPRPRPADLSHLF